MLIKIASPVRAMIGATFDPKKGERMTMGAMRIKARKNRDRTSVQAIWGRLKI